MAEEAQHELVGPGGWGHELICGDNLEVLPSLAEGSIDVVYIDPPYNARSPQTTYRDRRGDWVEFMRPRLEQARRVMAARGVIIVAVDDAEHARLRLLMDEVFGAQGFLANLVWEGVRRNSATYASAADYMLVYAANRAAYRAWVPQWGEPTPGAAELLERASRLMSEHGDHLAAQAALRAWIDSLEVGHPSAGLRQYRHLTPAGRLHYLADLGKPKLTSTSRYDLLHPVTQRPVPTPERGWVYAPATMAQKVAAGDVIFGAEESVRPRLRRYLDQVPLRRPSAVFYASRRAAAAELKDILGRDAFAYPKNTEVLARWISIVSGGDRDITVLDFFGGSGSTMQAVMELNEADSGRRRCTLVTNDEIDRSPGHASAGGIFTTATLPRIRTVVTGIRPDGSRRSAGTKQGVLVTVPGRSAKAA